MCELCSNNREERLAAIRKNTRIAKNVADLGLRLSLFGAYKGILPHSEEAKHLAQDVKAVIRDLVTEWL